MNQMRCALFSVLLIFLFSCKEDDSINESVSTQLFNFERTYGGLEEDIAHSILIKGDFVYVYGTSKSFDDINGDHYLIKLDVEGNIVFEKTYGESFAEEGIKIVELKDGNLMLLGTKIVNGFKDINILKIDVDGNLLWEQTYGGDLDDSPAMLVETSNSEFCIAGTTESYGAGARDIYLLWIDQNGNLIRQDFHGGIDLDGSSDLMLLENNELMLFGYTKNYGATSRDFYLLRMSASGDSIWSKRYGGVGYEESHEFSRTAEGGFLLSGHSSSMDPEHNMYGIKLDSIGNQIWEKNFGGSRHDGGESLLIDDNGNYVFVGRSMSFGNGSRNVFFTVTKANGTLVSETFYNGENEDIAYDIAESKDYYYIVGQTNSFNDRRDTDVYLVRHQK